MQQPAEWTPEQASALIARPVATDDKYSRGVLGVMTGSDAYPGAAVLGVESALRTSVGMVRYRGPSLVRSLVMQRRPEVVTEPGRVQAWLLGSGMATQRKAAVTAALRECLAEQVPTVLDASALDLVGEATAPVIITPHAGELGRMLNIERERIEADPAHWAATAARAFGVTVLLKGNRSHIAGPSGMTLVTPAATPWLATAGTGDALAGILGALVATHSRAIMGSEDSEDSEGSEREELLVQLAATASVVHSLAALRASAGGPFTVLDLTAALPATIAELLA